MLLIHILAQAAIAAAPPAVAATPQPGVTPYPASYFAAQNPGTAYDMLQRLPGFTLDTGSDLRGFESAAGNVLIDGRRPVTKTDSLQQILLRMPASAVDRIEVITGGAPGIDMQGKSVLANVILKKTVPFHGLIAAANDHDSDGRNVGSARVEANGGLGPGKWELGTLIGGGIDDGAGQGRGSYVFADGRAPLLSDIETFASTFQGTVTGAYETPLYGGTLRINGRWYKDKYKYTEVDHQFAPTVSEDAGLEYDRTREHEAGLNYTRPIGSKLDLEIVALRHPKTVTIDQMAGLESTPERFFLERRTVETIGRGVLKYQASSTLSLEAGAENAVNTLHSHTALSEDGVPQPVPAANVIVREDRAEGFLKGVWRPTPRWTVDAAFRYEHSKLGSAGDIALSKTLQFAKPRLTVIFAPTPSTQIRARVEREVGQLNFSDFVASANINTGSGVVAGNPDLNPEQAWVGELAVEQRFWGAGDVTVAVRHYKIKDAIDRGPVFASDGTVFDRAANIGGGTKDELYVDFTLPLDRLGVPHGQLKGDLTRRWSDVTDPTTHQKREISALHSLDWNAHFTQDIPSWNLSWGVDVAGVNAGGFIETSYRYNLIETVKARPYVTPWAEWRPRPDINVRLELDNVTQRNFRRIDYFYPGPRSAGGRPDIQDRNLNNGTIYHLRIRKTFG